jgi:hypothetical protein
LDDHGVNRAVGIRIETIERRLPAHRRGAAHQQQGDGKQ